MGRMQKIKREQRERVRMGALLLDEKVPNWHLTVNDSMLSGSFEMADWDRCVIGQLELVQYLHPNNDHYGHHYIVFNGEMMARHASADQFGFITTDEFDPPWDRSQTAWLELEKMWREEIELRVKLDNAKIEHLEENLTN